MHVFVNDRPVAVPPEETRTLGALIDGLRRREEIPQAEAVIALSVDGCPWGADKLERADETPLAERQRIEIRTAGLNEYARRALRDARSMLHVMTEAAGAVARHFREGPPEEANAHLYHLLEALHRFLGFLQRVGGACAPGRPALGADGRHLRRVADALQTVQSCQEQSDWSGLAARLEEELAPALQEFETPLDALAGEI